MTNLEKSKAERILAAKAFIFDMDGTLVLGDSNSGGHRPLAGAPELLALLRKRNIPFRVFTNGTAKSPAAYAASLRSGGLDIDDSEMMTPSTVAALWFLERGIKRVRVLGLEGVQTPLRELGLDVIAPGEKADQVEAVYTGWFREFTFPDLEAACADVWSGAILTTGSNVPFFAAQGGRAIGASFVINAMIRSLTGKRAQVLGKPSVAALHSALRLMDFPAEVSSNTLVVGDDMALEMRMANEAGAMAIAVTTGLNDRQQFLNAVPLERAHVVLSSLEQLVEVMS